MYVLDSKPSNQREKKAGASSPADQQQRPDPRRFLTTTTLSRERSCAGGQWPSIPYTDDGNGEPAYRIRISAFRRPRQRTAPHRAPLPKRHQKALQRQTGREIAAQPTPRSGSGIAWQPCTPVRCMALPLPKPQPTTGRAGEGDSDSDMAHTHTVDQSVIRSCARKPRSKQW